MDCLSGKLGQWWQHLPKTFLLVTSLLSARAATVGRSPQREICLSTFGTTQAEKLTSISIVTEFGALGPLTESGTIMVNNISTSCCKCHLASALYETLSFADASYPHHLAHFALLPARWWPHIFLDNEESQTQEGTRSYITNIKWLGRLDHHWPTFYWSLKFKDWKMSDFTNFLTGSCPPRDSGLTIKLRISASLQTLWPLSHLHFS